MSKFEMSRPTKKKALKLSKNINECIEDNCYFIATKQTKLLLEMLERHLRKELK